MQIQLQASSCKLQANSLIQIQLQASSYKQTAWSQYSLKRNTEIHGYLSSAFADKKKFVKRGTSRFLCRSRLAARRFPISWSGLHECEAKIREEGTTQVSLSWSTSATQVSDIIDSNPHECVGIFVKKEPSRFLCRSRQATRRFPILWFKSSRT
jgi:hypothetical protein